MAIASGTSPGILLTKSDLEGDPAARIDEVRRVAADVPVHAISSLTGDGLDVVRGAFEGGRCVALIGASGTGKSTLVNRLLGNDFQPVSAIAADGRGRDTTTWRALAPVPGGGVVIHTRGPGATERPSIAQSDAAYEAGVRGRADTGPGRELTVTGGL